MNKLYLLLILSVFLLSFSSAIKISPTQQELVMKQHETNCTNIWILPEADYVISSRWSYEGRGDLAKYTLSTKDIKLNINYSYESEGKYTVCFTPQKAGNLSGILYFYDEKKMIEIGSWIDLKVEQVGNIERISLITGNAVKNYEINTTNIILGIIFVLLLIIFLLIIRRQLRIKSFKNKHS
jgi:hypothetical protein